MTFEDELAREAAELARDHLAERGRDIRMVVVALKTEHGDGAIVGMHAIDGDREALLGHLAEFMTILAESVGKRLEITEVE